MQQRYGPLPKRVLDVLLALAMLIPAGPLMILLALVALVVEGRPVFYAQFRSGHGGLPFRIVKFRTMVPRADRIGGSTTAGDDPRITRLGRFLRDSKLDELPQLFNVLAGHMSIVGPRPDVLSETLGYGAAERQVLSVRPGLTDWATIRFRDEQALLSGKYDAEDEYHRTVQPLKLDLARRYVEQRSMWVDIQIVLRTAGAIARL